MKKFLWVLLILGRLFAQTNHPYDLFQIDAKQRGMDFSKALTAAFTLSTTYTVPTPATPIPQAGNNTGEVVIQTMGIPLYENTPFSYTKGVVNGVIPYVQQGTSTGTATITFPLAAPNSTLFIFAYNPNGQTGITPTSYFIVAGIEQITNLAYRPTITPAFPQNALFTSTYSSNIYPLYNINPTYRAQDIQFIANTFITNPTAFFGTLPIGSNSQVWILTTLTGPFYNLPTFSKFPGLLPNVIAISVLSNEYLLITYQPISFTSNPWSVIVSAEQVQQIIFYPINAPRS